MQNSNGLLLRLSRFSGAVFSVCGMIALTGCGGGGPATASVTGKVTYMSQPVKGGSLTFVPLGQGNNLGKPGTATVKEDGTFVVGTNSASDGAVIGKHRVTYSAPVEQLQPPDGKPFAQGASTVKKTPWDGLAVKQMDVEVKAGGNSIDLELIKPGAK